jgi:hypothetical protein
VVETRKLKSQKKAEGNPPNPPRGKGRRINYEITNNK